MSGARPEPLRRRARAALIRGLVGGAGFVPTSALGATLRPIARAAFARRYATVVQDNLARALPGLEALDAETAARLRADPEAFARRVADFTVEQALHWIRLARGAAPGETSGAWVEDLVDIDDSIERLDEALAAGRGAIIVTAHIGDWELLCARLRRRGHRGAVVGRVRRRDSSHRWLVEMRRAYGVDTIAQDASPREPLRVLRDGGVLGLLTDLRVKRLAGRAVPFFGEPALTMTAPAAFARTHGAPLVPVRCVRLVGANRYRLSVDPPLVLPDAPSRDAAEAELLAAQNRTFERWIAETPEQWAWHQRRW